MVHYCWQTTFFNRLDPEKCERFKSIIFIIQKSSKATRYEIALRWMLRTWPIRSQHWCRQATSHCLSQCWLRSMSLYGIIIGQAVHISWNAWGFSLALIVADQNFICRTWSLRCLSRNSPHSSKFAHWIHTVKHNDYAHVLLCCILLCLGCCWFYSYPSGLNHWYRGYYCPNDRPTARGKQLRRIWLLKWIMWVYFKWIITL